MNKFEVSIIIPLYNAKKYIERAIESAIYQKYVGEIIVVDDGYPDGAFALCLKLQERYEKLKVFQHENGENRGAGASRNLGISKAKCSYIAFLDADDYYLEDRFKQTRKAFESDKSITAVYEPIGTTFESEAAKKQFCNWRKLGLDEADGFVTYMKGQYVGKEFLLKLLDGKFGSPSTDGITVKASSFRDGVLFNERLRLHQDIELWTRLAYYGCFSPVSNPIPIAMRYVHLENRISTRNYESVFRKEKELYSWAKKNVKDTLISNLILKRYIYSFIQHKLNSSNIFIILCSKIIFTFARMVK